MSELHVKLVDEREFWSSALNIHLQYEKDWDIIASTWNSFTVYLHGWTIKDRTGVEDFTYVADLQLKKL